VLGVMGVIGRVVVAKFFGCEWADFVAMGVHLCPA
jgi:hypothetical protein